ncbi:MAG: sulfatase-like hydrolase/transferase, partial [Pirellulaceae bacterium]|nr:sulfatase-like hydrolase/transferase [Pirellulaceae bacterium]
MRSLSISVAALLALAPPVDSFAQQTAGKPCFVFIQGEGQGWASTSVQLDPSEPESKSRSFLTPNLQRIAREGVRFSNFYAPSPRCTPSRATYFTGISPAQLRMTFTSPGGDTGRRLIEPRVVRELPTEITTVAEMLKDAGYATAHFGKWHVGRMHPRQHGFDESDGATSNGGPENSRNPNPKQAYRITERGVDFIERQTKAGKPFYLQLSHYGGRSQADAKRETFERVLRLGLGRNDRNVGAAAVALDMDITIGMVLDKLDELDIADNTYVIYTADHGTPGRNGPLQGGKGGLWDGGIRIPLFIRGPAAKHGAHCTVRVTGADLMPTIAELAGVGDKLPSAVEGGSLKELLADPKSEGVTRRHGEIVFHFPHYDKDSLGPVSSIIAGNYKLIRVYEDGRRLLFDLSEDIGERNDLAGSLPAKVRELDAQLTDYLTGIDADLPTVRPGAGTPTVSNQQAPRSRRDSL